MNENPPKTKPAQDISWRMLLSLTGIFVGVLSLLRYNVIYTEGEVMQGLFTMAIGGVAACAAIGFQSRRRALWSVMVLGGSLLLWQAYQLRKWAVIQEDMVDFVYFAEETKRKTGQYPTGVEGYTFKNPQMKAHIYEVSFDEGNGFRVSYFMNQPGITYWYSSKTGFGYYPD
jgi:hypothetical protein